MLSYNEVTRPVVRDGFTTMLKEAADYFADRGVQMTGNGFSDILAESALFEDYKAKLSAGLPADQVANFEALMENARMEMLREASVAGVQQIAGLSMPTIRKMWAKIALKHAIPTEVVKAPRFVISYTKAFIITPDGKKFELPNELNKLDNTLAQLPRLDRTPVTVPQTSFDLFSLASGFSADKHDTIDKVFSIDSVKVDVQGTDVDVVTDIRTDLHANLYGQVTGIVYQMDNSSGHSVPKIGPDGKPLIDKQETDTIFGKVNYTTGKMEITSLKGKIKSVILNARISQETNMVGESVVMEVLTKDVEIGVGTHLNAPLPIEWLQDTMAIYNIDGAAEIVDLMSQTTAQKLEIEINNFLDRSIEINDVPYRGAFNVRPSAGFAGSPKEWREELKTVIDHLAIRMKRDSKFEDGKFVIVGSPVDIQLIPNVNWVFSNNTDDMGGVSVSYSLGAFSGTNRYEIVSSDLLPDGKLKMFFVPNVDRLMTYKYYPYTFNVEKGYRDPNFPNVPSIMMTKRHRIEEFTPLISEIIIENNNGKVPFTAGY